MKYRLRIEQLGLDVEIDLDPIATPPPAPNPPQTGFHVEQGRIIDPDGKIFCGGGMNVSVGMVDPDGRAHPYIFDGLNPDGSIDIWLGGIPDGIHPGGPIGSITAWSPDQARWVRLPDRAYGLNGVVSAAAAKAGITTPSDHWHQRILRINCVTRGDDDIPTPDISIPWYLDKIAELVSLGFVVVPSYHALTELGPTATAAQLADFRAFTDAVVDRFAGDPFVWLGGPNEPWPTGPDSKHRDLMVTFADRARERGWTGIITIPLAVWCQDLRGASEGRYDWIASIPNAVAEWHAYGADTGNGAYTAAEMDRQLDACRERGLAVFVGEYGQPDPLSDGNAGPEEWNVAAVDVLARRGLAVRHQLPICWWHGTGDQSHWHTYRLTKGPHGQSLPVWRAGPDDLTEGGVAHWILSHRLHQLGESVTAVTGAGLSREPE